MKTVEQKIISFIKKQKLLEEDDKVLVALSGGPDSVFALLFFHKFQGLFNIKLGAAHVNHLLRGKAADDDMHFCKSLCENLNIEYFEKRINVQAYAQEQQISFEEAGRKVRYNFFSEIAEENSFSKIVTAHTLDDNAETVLLNLIKGAGINGLSGIPIHRDNIIRPLLPVTKAEILVYLDENRIQYRIDESNFETKYERNFIRKEVLPLIKEKLNPSIEQTLFTTSEIFRSFRLLINEGQNIEKVFIIKDRHIEFLVDDLNSSNKALFSENLRKVISEKFFSEFNFDDFEIIRRLAESQTGKKVNLPGNLFAFKEREKIIILREEKNNKIDLRLSIGEERLLNGHKFSIRRHEKDKINYDANKFHEFIDADNLNDQFIIRNWEPGDKFIPLGMKGFKKVSDYLTDIKVQVVEKKEKLVLVNQGKIVWLVGYQIDDRVKIKNTTKEVLELCLM